MQFESACKKAHYWETSMTTQQTNDAIEQFANGTAFVDMSMSQALTGNIKPIKTLLAEQVPAHQHAEVLALVQDKLNLTKEQQIPDEIKPPELG
jgi:hypothetical protein